MSTRTASNTAAFSTKKYIPRSWDGIRDFFDGYINGMAAIKDKAPFTQSEIDHLAAATAALTHTNLLVNLLETYLAAVRAFRVDLITQKGSAKLSAPSEAHIAQLVGMLQSVPGGLLWTADNFTDRVRRSSKCGQEELDLLGVTYGKNRAVPPETAVGKLYPLFDGGKVDIHWTLPRGYGEARLSRSVNHGEWHALVTTDTAHFTDEAPIPAQSEIRAYKLEIMQDGKPIGKPAIDKILVGMDISVEETRL